MKPNLGWLLLGIVLAGIGSGGARAAVYQLTLLPAQPHAGDSVYVVVNGIFAAACWNDMSQTCAVAGDSLKVTVDVQYCGGLPTCGCAQVICYYTRTCGFGPLSAGAHIAAVTENHINPYDDDRTTTTYLPFTIADLVPVLPASWGRIKLLYR